VRKRIKRTEGLLDAAERAERWTAVSQLTRVLVKLEAELDTLEEQQRLAAQRAEDGGDNEGAREPGDFIAELSAALELLPDSVVLEVMEQAGKGYLLGNVVAMTS
jgi:hypothetical protein